MIYLTWKPRHPQLASCIDVFWYVAQRHGEGAQPDPVMVPDGQYHMVINLGAPHTIVDKNGTEIAVRMSHMNAIQNHPVTIKRSGDIEVISIVFRPYGLAPFLQDSMRGVPGAVWNMADLLGSSPERIEERLQEEADVQRKFALLEQELLSLMSDRFRLSADLHDAVDMLMRHKGAISVRELCERTQLSERTLERQFKDRIGISPKHFAKLRRFQHALQHIKTTDRDMLTAALQAGYYDQSHLHKEFLALTGAAPSAYVRKRNLLSDLYAR
jgi:AraC-like DNA-binding protein